MKRSFLVTVDLGETSKLRLSEASTCQFLAQKLAGLFSFLTSGDVPRVEVEPHPNFDKPDLDEHHWPTPRTNQPPLGDGFC